MALTPQIDNQIKNETNLLTIPSKTYGLTNDMVTTLIEGETKDEEEYNGQAITIETKDKISEFELRGNAIQIQPESGTEIEGTNITITDYNTAKQSKFTKLSGDTFQQTYTGKNAFNKAKTPDRTASASVTELPTGIKVTNTVSGNNHIVGYVIDNTSNLYNKTIRISTDVSVSNTQETQFTLVVASSDLSQRETKQAITGNGHKETSYIVEDNDVNKVILLQFYSNRTTESAGVYTEFANLIVTINNEDMTYEPFVGNQPSPSPDYPQDIQVVTGDNNIYISNKNLFTGFTKGIGINASTGAEESNADRATSNYIQVDFTNNTNYTLSGIVKTLYFGVYGYDENKNFLGRLTADLGVATRTFQEVFSGVKYIRISQYTGLHSTSTIDAIDTASTQLETGNQATTYIAHQDQNFPISLGNIELAKIGNYQDKIIKKSDGWYFRKEIEKITFNGTEVGWFDSTNPSPYKTRFLIPRPTALKTQQIALSKFFVSGSNYQTTNNCVYIATNYLIFSNVIVNGDYLPNTTSFRNWITNNNQTLYCILETPIETKITDTTLINQLNAIEQATGYTGTTYIVSTNENNLAVIPTYKYNYMDADVKVFKTKTTIIVQRTNQEDFIKELNIGAYELVKVNDTYQDKIYKDEDKWYISKATAKISSYNGETISTPYISSTGELTTGAKVYYGQEEVITEITDNTLKTNLNALLALDLDREGTIFTQEVDTFIQKPFMYIKAYERKVELSIQEVDRIMGFVDGLEAVKQAIYHILQVERYAYLIYDDNYGIELNQYIGRSFEYLESTIQETLREALLQDLRILDVTVTQINKLDTDIARVVFEVRSIYGNLQMEVDINV